MLLAVSFASVGWSFTTHRTATRFIMDTLPIFEGSRQLWVPYPPERRVRAKKTQR